MGVINHTVHFPYLLSARKLASKFRLPETVVTELGERLGLDIRGRERKNELIEIEVLIKYNPELTAIETAYRSGLCLTTVYAVGRKLNHKFKTQYTVRA